MAKAITSIGTFSNTEKVIRQSLSRMMDDCITGVASAGTTTTITCSSMNPPQFYNKADDYFNDMQYEVYINAGTNIGATYVCSDWDNSTHKLTVTPTASSAFTTSSVPELHRIFYVVELREAINRAIDFYSTKYLLDLQDNTTTTLVRTAYNNNSSAYIYTYEYALPTTCLYLNRVITEHSVAGVKVTGTLSDDLTLGEQVLGSSSAATALVSFTDATTGYCRLREEDGTITTSDTLTGQTSGETVSSITDITRTELSGDGVFRNENIVDPRDWRIIKAYAPKIKFDENQYTVVEDLRIQYDFQGIQDVVDDDTDTIMLPPDEFVEVAATFLPFSKIESNNLTAVFNKCMKTRDRVEQRPPIQPYANARKCW